MLELPWLLSFLLLGSVVGFMAGLLGIGGGGIMVPVLTSIFLLQGIEADKVMHMALGTSMASIIITSFSSARAHYAHHTIVWPIVKNMSVGIIIGTFGATFIASSINSFYLAVFFTLFMAYVAGKMFLNKQPTPKQGGLEKKDLLVVGTGIGAISALVSIGGGSLTVPYLAWRNIDIKKAIGTSAAIGLPISISGTLGYLINGWHDLATVSYSYGYVYLPAVLLISCASYVTAPYGVSMVHRLPVALIKKLFALLLMLLCLKMLLSIVG